MTENIPEQFDPEMLEIIEGMLTMCVNREKQIADLNQTIEDLKAQLKDAAPSESGDAKSGDTEPSKSIGPTHGVLIIDSSTVFQKKLGYLLESNGYAIVGTATDYEQGVQMVGYLNPKLVMIDFNLPDTAGLLACKKIKSKHPDIKVIITSNQLEENIIFKAVQYGADEYIAKPLHPERLLQILDNLECA